MMPDQALLANIPLPSLVFFSFSPAPRPTEFSLSAPSEPSSLLTDPSSSESSLSVSGAPKALTGFESSVTGPPLGAAKLDSLPPLGAAKPLPNPPPKTEELALPKPPLVAADAKLSLLVVGVNESTVLLDARAAKPEEGLSPAGAPNPDNFVADAPPKTLGLPARAAKPEGAAAAAPNPEEAKAEDDVCGISDEGLAGVASEGSVPATFAGNWSLLSEVAFGSGVCRCQDFDRLLNK